MTQTKPHAVIIGAGSGLSAALAREFRADHTVTLAATTVGSGNWLIA